MEQCECSEEWGPCEDHCETLVIREGASQRTADSLLLLLCHDLIDCGAEVSPYGRSVLEEADKAEDTAMSSYGTSWFLDEPMTDALVSLADQLEATSGLSVYEDDGYRIVRIADDCPLIAEGPSYADVIGGLIELGGVK